MYFSPRCVLVTGLLFGSLLLSSPAFAATRQGFSIRNDGVILKNGVPEYPFGFYHVSDVQVRYGDKMAGDVEKMGQAGFNLLQLVVTGPDAEASTEKARLKAKEYGMSIIASYFRPNVKLTMERLKDDPTILAWNTLDDFNVPYKTPKRSPAEALEESKIVWDFGLSISSPSLTYGSGGGYPFAPGNTNNKYAFGAYKDAMDIVGVQTYPIGNTDDSFANAPLEENIAYLKHAKEQMPTNKPVLANLQSFAWTGKRYPNVAETRNMTWAAVVTDLEGILAYAYWEESGDLSTKNDIWEEWKKLRQDINGELVQAILNGTYTYIDTTPGVLGKPRIHAATFEHNKKVFVIAMNTNSQSAVTTTNQITLPKTVDTSTMKPLFPGDTRYPTTLQLATSGDTSVLNGSLDPSSVQAYVFTVSGGGTGETPLACRSDFNDDGKVDTEDFVLFKGAIFRSPPKPPKTDIDRNGRVNIKDFHLFVQDFLKVCRE